ncbi:MULTISPECIES: S8 family serine peptidase [unclassified Streptomyces]|uniref:S8 family serine peptidase n=1 Tax=unclassified Streptomyces TaxID=2593676 RepID=UPI000DC7EC69|nr:MULTISPECIES: S8 family serine peptidase [unclassified Streptomyces]AWZ05312.1 peptidase [Streptomyces sp. ICC4]AWZ11440.1 peptidase [Streptomyces sp. ICC1]
MRRRTRLLLCTTVLAALAGPAPLAAARVANDGPTTLPGVPDVLASGQGCTTVPGKDTAAAPWTRGALGLEQVWRLSRGRGVTVAVVGTGVSDAPAVLAGRVRVLGDAGRDCVGRGTFQAGLVAGAALAGQGFSGVAPEARILAVRGTGERGEPDAARLAAGVREAAEAGAGVITVTAPLDGTDPRVVEAMAVARAKDALVIAPAAADGPPPGGGDPQPAPVAPAQALAVLDTGPQGTRPESAPPFRHADLSAPGGALVGPGPVGNGKWTGSGASMAAAVTAGTAALVRAYHPGLNAEGVRGALLAGAYPGDLPALDPYGAVSGVAPGTAAPAEAARVDPVSLPEAPRTAGARTTALLVTAVAGGTVLLVAFLAVVLPRGRSRGWRPGRLDDRGTSAR